MSMLQTPMAGDLTAVSFSITPDTAAPQRRAGLPLAYPRPSPQVMTLASPVAPAHTALAASAISGFGFGASAMAAATPLSALGSGAYEAAGAAGEDDDLFGLDAEMGGLLSPALQVPSIVNPLETVERVRCLQLTHDYITQLSGYYENTGIASVELDAGVVLTLRTCG
jgi:hypothetical protein